MSARPTMGPMTAPAIQALEPPLLLLLLLLLSLVVSRDPKPVDTGWGIESAALVLVRCLLTFRAGLMTYVRWKKPQ
jgi:hypothetical protein